MSVAYLFDTDAISHLFKKSPVSAYVQWVKTIPPEAQFTCAPVIAELFAGAHGSGKPAHFEQIRRRVIPEISVLPFALREAEVYGKIRAALHGQGQVVADMDLMIAACAMSHGLELITGNRRHFERIIPLGLACCWVLADAVEQASRAGGSQA